MYHLALRFLVTGINSYVTSTVYHNNSKKYIVFRLSNRKFCELLRLFRRKASKDTIYILFNNWYCKCDIIKYRTNTCINHTNIIICEKYSIDKLMNFLRGKIHVICNWENRGWYEDEERRSGGVEWNPAGCDADNCDTDMYSTDTLFVLKKPIWS